MAALAAERDSAMTGMANSMCTGELAVFSRSGGGNEGLREMTNCNSTSGGTSGPIRSIHRTTSSSRSTGYWMRAAPMNPGLG